MSWGVLRRTPQTPLRRREFGYAASPWLVAR